VGLSEGGWGIEGRNLDRRGGGGVGRRKRTGEVVRVRGRRGWRIGGGCGKGVKRRGGGKG